MSVPLEIERSFLLASMPTLPTDDRNRGMLRIEQGYLREIPEGKHGSIEGRIRRTEHPDGRITCVHTIKHGTGLVRTEQERSLEPSEFDALWPRTEGRRLTKERHRIREGDLLWEIDRFLEIDLVLAEVELPTVETDAPMPDWLACVVVREVTDEPEYRNFALATRRLNARQ